MQNVDEISDKELDSILSRFNWGTPPALTPEQGWLHLPTSKYVRRVAIFKDIKNWGIKPEEGGDVRELNEEELVELADYLAELEELNFPKKKVEGKKEVVYYLCLRGL